MLTAGFTAGVMLVGSTISLAASEENITEKKILNSVSENITQIQEISFGENVHAETEQLGKPKAMPVVIANKEKSNAKNIVTKNSIQVSADNAISYASKSSVSVKTSKAFFKKLHDKLTERKKSFTITYKGNYTDIYKGNIETMFKKAWNQDDKKTSDDFDYLYPNIKVYGFSIPSYSSKKSVFQFKIVYRESAAQMKKVNTKIKSVLKSLKLSKLSDEEKVKKIHDYIINLFSYDRTLSRFTAYEGLIDSKHTTVCQGYSVLMYKMLTEAGVSCRYVTGQAGGAHAWNIVKIGGKWYHLDVTWDDPVSNIPQLSYDYFLTGANTISIDHVLDKEFRTASFKKNYPISKKDYTWKNSSTKPKDKVDQVVEKKQKFNKELVAALNQVLEYDTASELNKKIYDVYKEIITGVFMDMEDNLFLSMYEQGDPDNILGTVLNSADEKIQEEIIKPMNEYIDSEEFEDAYTAAILENYTLNQWNKLTSSQKKAVLEQYMIVEFEKKLQSISAKKSEKIISEILNEI